MAVSKALARLLRVRALEEEQRKLALEAELARLHRADAELEACKARERGGRALLRSGDGVDRVTAAVEMEAARKQGKLLEQRRSAAEREAEGLRAAYLEKRTERRQAEALIEGARASEELAARQRAQQQIDDWHGSRREVTGRGAGGDRPAGAKHEGNMSAAGQKLP
ncbi:MAG: hypothetical protein ACLGSD_05925 [Acidobacteriota bacterium]